MQYHVYSDASFNPKTKSGVAGFIITSNANASLEIKTEIIKHTTCTRLELQGIIWALRYIDENLSAASITLYTDCKTACDLLRRRSKLECVDFSSGKTGEPLKNADVYKEYFKLLDKLKPELVWVKGHMPHKQRDHIQSTFAQLDKHVRQALRALSEMD